MIEIIGLIASAIAILGAIYSIIKYFSRSRITRRKELHEVKKIIEDHYQRWKEFGYLARDESLIFDDEFIKIDKHRDHLSKLDSNKFLFLFRCSLQNGLKGNWGKWIHYIDSFDKITNVLISTLDGKAGLRPTWRSAYLLDKIYDGNYKDIRKKLPSSYKLNQNVREILNVIKNEGVEKYLLKISDGKNSSIKRKAIMVLHEIDYFNSDIQRYYAQIGLKSKEM